jgi:hypothetical protein
MGDWGNPDRQIVLKGVWRIDGNGMPVTHSSCRYRVDRICGSDHRDLVELIFVVPLSEFAALRVGCELSIVPLTICF